MVLLFVLKSTFLLNHFPFRISGCEIMSAFSLNFRKLFPVSSECTLILFSVPFLLSQEFQDVLITFKKLLYFQIILDLHKSCKNRPVSFQISFTQFPSLISYQNQEIFLRTKLLLTELQNLFVFHQFSTSVFFFFSYSRIQSRITHCFQLPCFLSIFQFVTIPKSFLIFYDLNTFEKY